MENQESTSHNSLSQIHPALLVGRFATMSKDFYIGCNQYLPVKGEKVLITGCRLKTEVDDFDFEVMFEVLDASFTSTSIEKDWYTVQRNEIDTYFTGVHV